MQDLVMNAIVVGWIRRRHTSGLAGLREWPDKIPRLKRLIDLWDVTFGPGSYREFRTILAQIADEQSAIPRIDDWRTITAEWLAPVDDDDWHLPGLADALAHVPDEYSMVCWSVHVADLTEAAIFYTEDINYQRGPQTCGYAIRRSILPTLTDRQLHLIRDDHRNAHRYIDFLGSRYLCLPEVFGQYVRTPASISSIATETAKRLSVATVEQYNRLISQIPQVCSSAMQRVISEIVVRIERNSWRLGNNWVRT
jgi:hypothetical protein